jgi:hypothetical protein
VQNVLRWIDLGQQQRARTEDGYELSVTQASKGGTHKPAAPYYWAVYAKDGRLLFGTMIGGARADSFQEGRQLCEESLNL